MSITDIENLDDNWDGYGAPKISKIAINNCKSFIDKINKYNLDTKTLPHEYGGVTLEISKGDLFINICFGDTSFSYYVEGLGRVKYYSFLEYTENNINDLINYVKD